MTTPSNWVSQSSPVFLADSFIQKCLKKIGFLESDASYKQYTNTLDSNVVSTMFSEESSRDVAKNAEFFGKKSVSGAVDAKNEKEKK